MLTSGRRTFFLALAAVATLAAPAFAADGKTYKPPRTAEGKPSFEGNWSIATITALQRPADFKSLVLPPDQVEAATNSHPQVVRQRNDDNLSEETPLTGQDLRGGRGYNAFWIDPGMSYANVRGEYRTSWIVDPPDGQIPFLTNRRGRDIERSSFDGPEGRPLGERCIVNSGSAGPPMQKYLYNNNYEIVQTAQALVIRAEMNNYARIIRIGGKHIPPSMRPLHGDSIGHWEGDTLVAETTNFHPFHAQGQVPLTEQGKVIEKFSRTSNGQITYEFTVEDPQVYRQPWRAEISLNAIKDRVFEYACHEGNYALSGVLAGAREEEKRAAAKK
jgi:hypothetical protein